MCRLVEHWLALPGGGLFGNLGAKPADDKDKPAAPG